jgi:ATP-dependent DNA ligase
MINYALEWKKYVNFKELPYNDFISTFSNIHGYYLEKYDGRLSALVYSKGNRTYLQSTTGIKFYDLPVIDEYDKILNSMNVENAVLMGELIAIRNGTILRFNESESVIKLSRLEQNKPLIHHYLYDVYVINGKKNRDYSFSVKYIQNNFKNKKLNFINFPGIDSDGIEGFKKLYKDSVIGKKPGVEGIVARTSKGNFKIKPVMTFDMVIIGVGNEHMISWNRSQISYLIPAFLDKDGHFRRSSNIGTGFTHTMRNEFFNFYQQKNLGPIDTKGDFFVYPKIVIEVQWRNFHIQEMECYAFEKGKFVYVGKKPSISMIMPSFKRIREDKKINDWDLRLEQIPNFKG